MGFKATFSALDEKVCNDTDAHGAGYYSVSRTKTLPPNEGKGRVRPFSKRTHSAAVFVRTGAGTVGLATSQNRPFEKFSPGRQGRRRPTVPAP
jgi:hypothetical protein